jgi:hypothetical protein
MRFSLTDTQRTLLAFFPVCMVACGTSEVGKGSGGPAEHSDEVASTPIESRLPGSHQRPVMSIDLPNEKIVELYDYGQGGVLAMEQGKAATDATPILPKYRSLIESNRVVDLFVALRPDLPVPRALVDLQSRLKIISVTDSDSEVVSTHGGATREPHEGNAGSLDSTVQPKPLAEPSGGSGASGSGSGGGVEPQACGNTCCNNSDTGTYCQDYVYDWSDSWFYPNGQYWYEDGTNVAHFEVLTCSGIGTTYLGVSVSSGAGGGWQVLQGYYEYYWWNYNGSNRQTVGSDATTYLGDNDPGGENTFCGSLQ